MTVADDVQPIASPPSFGLLARLSALFQRRATWVLIDQAIVSAGNFLTAQVLVRHLIQAEFGMSNVLTETMNYLAGLQAALIIYPLTIKGATGRDWDLGTLTSGAARLTFGLLPLLGGITIAAVAALQGGPVAISAVVALLLWQLQETMRRALMSDMRFADAVWGDAIRYLGQTLLVLIFAHYRLLDLNVAFILMGFSAAIAAIVQAFQVKLKPIRFWQLKLLGRDFWKLGRWMLLSSASGVITTLGYWWVLNWAGGKASVAIFGAIILPFKLANPIMTSMGALVMPAVARAAATTGMRDATRLAWRYILFGGALLGLYFSLLLAMPYLALRIFCGKNSEYLGYTTELQMFVINYAIVYAGTMASSWLGGLGRARWSFYAQVVNIVTTLLIGLPFTAYWGVRGLILGGMISAGVGTVTSAYFIGKARRATMPAAD